MSAAGNVTAVGSFIIGDADMSEADLEKLDGITNGTVAANKAVVVDANKDASGFRNVTAEGSFIIGSASFIIGSADMDETDLEKLDGITNGTAAASKALVLDANKDIAGIRHLDLDGDLTAATVTMTGFTVDADGDVALKSLAVDDGSTIGCDSDTDLMSLADGALTVNGTLSADTSFTLDAVTVDATELGYLDGVTAGTAASSKALVLDANGAVGTITHLTATYAQIDVLDVNEINSVTRTETTLEVVDKLILAASGSNAAASDAGGLQIGGTNGSDTVASVLYDNANSALDFNIGGTTQVRLADGVLRPETDDDVDLGASGAEFKDLYLDGVAYVDELRADLLGAALDANSQAITNINVDSGVIDGTVIGGNSAAAGTFTSLAATSLDLQGGDLSDAGDVNVDSISAAATDMDFLLTDNSATALEIKEGSNNYMVFDTSNGAEAIYVYKEMEVQAGAVVYDDQEVQFATDDSGVGASGSLSYVSADDVFQISGSAANGLKLVGDINASGFAFQAAAGTLTSLSVSDGNITNVGDIALDSISADGTDIDFSLTDNSAAALEIKEGSNNYMVFDTTNGSELIDVYKEVEFRAGGLVRDDQTMTFGTDDDSSIQFVSAANTLKLTGGSSGIHLASATALGADGGGVNLTVYGGSANEQMVYTAADHTLKFVDASSATFLTMGGDADGEYAVDVADGSNAKNKIRAAAFVTYSDERLKTDVAPIEGGLNTVNSLRAVNFTWKKDGSRDFGFMAQELKRVVPQAVHGTDEGLYGVDYGRLSAILVSAIQEQSAQIASLKKQLENK
jgi:hypothetical protein